MKYGLFFLPILLLSSMTQAMPIADATIIKKGNDYSDISRLYQKTPKKTGWIELKDDTIYTPWAWHWAEYTAELTKGVWDIGLNVINHGNLDVNWYDTFQVRSRLTDSALISEEILNIEASDTQIHHAFSRLEIASAGLYTVQYQWLNDKWGGRNDRLRRDANLQIDSVFFNRVPGPSSLSRVPEPSSLALLSLGALMLISRKRIFTESPQTKHS